MKSTTSLTLTAVNQRTAWPRLTQITRGLLGMSRALVAAFVVAHAGLAAILALHRLPSPGVIGLGILACFFGTSALIGLNDVMDVDLDRRRLASPDEEDGLDLGSLLIHHPVAKGVISMRLALTWLAVLSVLSLYLINRLRPGLWPIFPAVGILVILYSWLGRVTHWKFLAVALAVSLGAVAGWLAVAPAKGPLFIAFAVWTFLWEIGGRNLPNDFNDLGEDKRLGVKTIPVVLGPELTARLVFLFLSLTTLASLPLLLFARFSPLFNVLALAAAVWLLLIPGYRLMRNPVPRVSRQLYNRSALYPPVLLIALMASLWLF